ncbi:MAG: deferrochelatase/peroxidase EfeB [Chloroflexi bacterium HGW-Chloroflexi-9]|nr:MAG: deferrochelatase/peroxidase EfeB [Chloroflexi bacterium HGW-Chloroflexi-9]
MDRSDHIFPSAGDETPGTSISRRQLLRRGLRGGLALAAVAGTAPLALGDAQSAEAAAPPFFGEHQAGIVTPPPVRVLFATFDLLTDSRADVAAMLQRWTAAGARITGSAPGNADGTSITVALGGSFFDRLGLQAMRPARLQPLPAFTGDALQPAFTGGDLAVQVCAAEATLATAILDEITTLGAGVVAVRAAQAGFREAVPARPRTTPRNLLGFKDGTVNGPFADGIVADQRVWIGSEGPEWLRGGSYVVMRRIVLDVAAWEQTSVSAQESVIGRHKASGAPLGEARERDRADLRARDAAGQLVIPVDAHIRRASPGRNGGARILRRGYNFDDSASTPSGGAGLLFLSYQRDPAQFTRIQSSLSALDALNRFSTVTGSGLYAVLPGTSEAGWLGDRLLSV